MDARELKLKFSADTGDASKNVIGLGEAHVRLLRVARELQSAFPALGSALAAFAGAGGAVYGAIEVYRHLTEEIEASNKALDEQMALNADPLFLAGIEAKKQSLLDAAIALDKYRAGLLNVITAEDTFRRVAEASTAAAKNEAEAQTRMATAAESLDLARLNAEHEQGLISDTQFYEQKLAIIMRFQRDKDAAEEAQRQKDIDTQKTEIADETVRQAQDQRLLATQTGPVNARAADVARDKATVANLKAYLVRLEKQTNEAEARARELRDTVEHGILGAAGDEEYWTSGLSGEQLVAQKDAEAAALRALVNKTSGYISSLDPGLPQRERDAASDADFIARYQEENKQLITSLTDHQAALDRNTAALASIHAANTAAAGAQELAGEMGGPIGRQVVAATFIATHLSTATRAEKDAMDAMAAWMTGRSMTDAQAAQFFSQAVKNDDAMGKLIEQAVKKGQEAEKKIASLRALLSQ